jgi:hypothetical protein
MWLVNQDNVFKKENRHIEVNQPFVRGSSMNIVANRVGGVLAISQSCEQTHTWRPAIRKGAVELYCNLVSSRR